MCEKTMRLALYCCTSHIDYLSSTRIWRYVFRKQQGWGAHPILCKACFYVNAGWPWWMSSFTVVSCIQVEVIWIQPCNLYCLTLMTPATFIVSALVLPTSMKTLILRAKAHNAFEIKITGLSCTLGSLVTAFSSSCNTHSIHVASEQRQECMLCKVLEKSSNSKMSLCKWMA